MNKVNPKFVLRNYLMEEAIRDAEQDNFTKVKELLRMSYEPFNEESIDKVCT